MSNIDIQKIHFCGYWLKTFGVIFVICTDCCDSLSQHHLLMHSEVSFRERSHH